MRGNYPYKRLGKKLFNTRKKKGWSQEDLSTLSEIDRTYIGRLENGKANPSFKTLCKLSRALKTDLSDLLKGG